MKVEIKVPALGESVLEATVSAILKPSGSFVKEDEEILELETDKVNQVLYAPKSGLLTLTVAKEQTVKIGAVVGFIETEATGSERPSSPIPVQEAQPKAKTPPPVASTTSTGVERTRMSGLRRMIAKRLVEAKNTTAMLTTFNEIDMTAVMAIRAKEQEAFQKKYGVKLGFMSFFVKAVVLGLKAYPSVNSLIEGEEIVTFHTYDIGIAVSTERGLIVPVVKNCGALRFGDIEKAIEKYGESGRNGTISVDDLKGGSFTITNGGVFGSLLSTPILNPPQSAILGMHAIVKRPVVVSEAIVIRPMMYVALSYDHRLIDGREAVLFLVTVKKALEDPSPLLLDL